MFLVEFLYQSRMCLSAFVNLVTTQKKKIRFAVQYNQIYRHNVQVNSYLLTELQAQRRILNLQLVSRPQQVSALLCYDNSMSPLTNKRNVRQQFAVDHLSQVSNQSALRDIAAHQVNAEPEGVGGTKRSK